MTRKLVMMGVKGLVPNVLIRSIQFLPYFPRSMIVNIVWKPVRLQGLFNAVVRESGSKMRRMTNYFKALKVENWHHSKKMVEVKMDKREYFLNPKGLVSECCQVQWSECFLGVWKVNEGDPPKGLLYHSIGQWYSDNGCSIGQVQEATCR